MSEKTFAVQRTNHKWQPWTNAHNNIAWPPCDVRAETAEDAAVRYMQTLEYYSSMEIYAVIDGQKFAVKCKEELTFKARAEVDAYYRERAKR